jgi:HEAT repeat protein
MEPSGLSTVDLLARVAEEAHLDAEGDRAGYWPLVSELRRRGDQQTYGQAACWCRSEDSLLRMLGAHLLGQLGCLQDYPFADAAAPVLLALLDDDEGAVVSASLAGLGFLKRGDPERLARMAGSPDAEIRFSLAFCLLTRDEPIARQTLISLSRDPDVDVRDWATFGLGCQSDVDNEEIRLALVERLGDTDAETRGEALVGLARRCDPRVEPALVAALLEPEVDALTFEAAEELGRRGDFLATLEALLQTNPDHCVLRTLVEGCRKHQGITG